MDQAKTTAEPGTGNSSQVVRRPPRTRGMAVRENYSGNVDTPRVGLCRSARLTPSRAEVTGAETEEMEEARADEDEKEEALDEDRARELLEWRIHLEKQHGVDPQQDENETKKLLAAVSPTLEEQREVFNDPTPLGDPCSLVRRWQLRIATSIKQGHGQG